MWSVLLEDDGTSLSRPLVLLGKGLALGIKLKQNFPSVRSRGWIHVKMRESMIPSWGGSASPRQGFQRFKQCSCGVFLSA